MHILSKCIYVMSLHLKIHAYEYIYAAFLYVDIYLYVSVYEHTYALRIHDINGHVNVDVNVYSFLEIYDIFISFYIDIYICIKKIYICITRSVQKVPFLAQASPKLAN